MDLQNKRLTGFLGNPEHFGKQLAIEDRVKEVKIEIRESTMAINKKSLVTKAPAKNSTATKSASSASKPVTPGKMVPAMRFAKAGLKITTGMTRF